MASNQSFMTHEDFGLDAALGFANVFIDDVGISLSLTVGVSAVVLSMVLALLVFVSVAGCWGVGNFEAWAITLLCYWRPLEKGFFCMRPQVMQKSRFVISSVLLGRLASSPPAECNSARPEAPQPIEPCGLTSMPRASLKHRLLDCR